MSMILRPAWGLIPLLMAAQPLLALDPALSLAQYLHNDWTQENGSDLPSIQTMAQTTDGYLWLGTGMGLIRFDGIRFVHWEPPAGEELPSHDIRFLSAPKDGSLWIVSALGVSMLQRGHVIAYPDADRWMGGGAIVDVLKDHLDRLWLVRRGPSGSLGMLAPQGSLVTFGQREGVPAAELRRIFAGPEDGLWMATSQGLCRWKQGKKADCLNIPPVNALSVARKADGDWLIGDGISRAVLELSNGVLRRAVAKGGSTPMAPREMLRDRRDNVWMGVVGQGLLRLHNGKLEGFAQRDGLSSDLVNCLLEDREGDLWIGTDRGIDRFRDPKIVMTGAREGLSSDLVTAVYAARPGGVWVGTYGGGLNRITATGIARYGLDAGLPSDNVFSLYEQENGELWVGTAGGLVHRSAGRFLPLTDANGVLFDHVFAICGNREGDVALADRNRGLFTVRRGVVSPLTVSGGTADPYQIQYDKSGTLWVGYFAGGIAAVHGTSTRVYTTTDHLAEGPIRAIYPDEDGDIWVGTGTGVSRFHQGSWTTWNSRNGLPAGGVRAIASADRALWLVTETGLVRVSRAELEGPSTPSRKLDLRFFGQGDGLRPAARGDMVNPPLAISSDGKIWVSTQNGVAILDPARMRQNSVAPPVVIEQMAVDGTPLDLNPPSRSFRGNQAQIVFTALSLNAPERIRFKYHLEGLDRNWIESDGRRSVTYVNLAPGAYRFRVIACNSDDVWNTQGASLAFNVKPYYYQTWWFAALCLAGVGLAIWGAHRLRVRVVVARLQIISRERVRLMRELHDSLLQGFVGVVYQLDTVARQFDTAPEASKRRLERAIEQADHSVQEARWTLSCMRLPALEKSSLPEALSAVAKQFSQDWSIPVSLEVKGRVQQLPYDQQANLYLIAREAMTNGVNHARASKIVTALKYSEQEVQLTVQDDGAGFDPEAGIAKKDHWGLRGMRERAESMGARFTLETAPGLGTKIKIAVPRK